MPKLLTPMEKPKLTHKNTRTGMDKRDGKFFYTMKWLCPMMFAMLGFYLQSVGLHYATYSYVHHMKNDLNKIERNTTHIATLVDPVEEELGPQVKTDMGFLDMLAALFPMCFMGLSAMGFYKKWHTLQVFTKVMVCAGFLFSLKGFIGAITNVPDSSGWEGCKDRLRPDGLKWMEDNHTLGDMFTVDYLFNVVGVTMEGQGDQKHTHPLRYCSDMMYSGHTFVVTLFALGLYEQARICFSAYEHTESYKKRWLKDKDEDQKRRSHCHYVRLKMALLCFISLIAVGEQCAEILSVLRSHFHYTSDVVMAVLLTFLFYTNGAIAVFSKQWEMQGLMIFFTFGKRHAHYDEWPWNMCKCAEKCFPAKDEVSNKEWIENEVWISKGDIFTPPCCLPFCCYAGRQHMYTDNGILEIALATKELKIQDDKKINEIIAKMKMEMNLHEGVSLTEFKDGCCCCVGGSSTNRNKDDCLKEKLLAGAENV